MPQTKKQIAKIIKELHKIVDNLEGSTMLEIEMFAHHIDVPGTGRCKEVAPTGEVSISISAYNPARDGRQQAFRLDPM